MARGDEDDRWIVELMNVHPRARVLEIGFGPGVAIGLLAERATQGLVAGVEPSDVMLRQASLRNRTPIASGRVELRLGTVDALPYSDGSFDRACAIHSLYFWPAVERGLREVARVLVPGGLLALGVRMRRASVGRLNPSRYGLTDADVLTLTALLARLGFTDVTTQQREFPRDTVTAIVSQLDATRRASSPGACTH
jgi:ubiquinone/menaquinone biosynthesis C-methylase UbiE